MTWLLLSFLTGLVVGGALGLRVRRQPLPLPPIAAPSVAPRVSAVPPELPAPTIVPLFIGGPSRYAVVSDAGTVKFPAEDDDATNGLAARKAFEAVSANPDGQCWSFLENGAVRSRVGVVS